MLCLCFGAYISSGVDNSASTVAEPGADGPQKQAEERLFLGWLFGRYRVLSWTFNIPIYMYRVTTVV